MRGTPAVRLLDNNHGPPVSSETLLARLSSTIHDFTVMACASAPKQTEAPGCAREHTPADGAKAGADGPTFAIIMERHKPNPWGPGHLKLYLLATLCFLNSTMSGTVASVPIVPRR